jgi:hypothetical protein
MQNFTSERLSAAVERVQWALAQPLRLSERAWGERLGRALGHLADELSRPAEWMQAQEVAFQEDGSLPLLPGFGSVASHRLTHLALVQFREEIVGLSRGGLKETVAHFPRAEYAFSPDEAVDGLDERQAFRALGILVGRTERLCQSLKRHFARKSADSLAD